MLYENLTEFSGKPVKDFDPDEGLDSPSKSACRIRIGYDDQGELWADKLAELLKDPAAGKIEALVVGAWEDVCTGTESTAVVEALTAARDTLVNLKHLFFGDIISEESEISWIIQSDLSPIFEAYPALQDLTIRGGSSLSLGRPRHKHLKNLTIQSGGLPPSVIHEIAGAEFPNLEHLELWLGDPNYGGEATVEDLAPLLRGDKFSRLTYLGLKDSVIQDEIAGVVANAPVVGRLHTLDLSLGQLGDDGARALLSSPLIKKLKRLDLHHHFISDELVAKLKALGIEVDLSDKQEPQEWSGQQHRFVAVSE